MSEAPAPDQQPTQARVVPRTNMMAVLALIFAFGFWPLALVFGHVARGQIRRTGEDGKNLTVIALTVSYVFAAITIGLFAFGFLLAVIASFRQTS